MDQNRAEWNKHHQALRQALKKPTELETAKQLFFEMHVPLHAQGVSGVQGWNLEEKLWEGLKRSRISLHPGRGRTLHRLVSVASGAHRRHHHERAHCRLRAGILPG